LIDGALPAAGEEAAFRSALAAARSLPRHVVDMTTRLADEGHDPMRSLRALLSIALDPTPSLDQSERQRHATLVSAIGMTPTILATVYRRRRGLTPLAPDPALSHSADLVRMITGSTPDEARAHAVETYLSLTADHGFNASTFTARVITSTGADAGAALAGAVGALMGPLHGGAPSRVLDMIDAIGDPRHTERWAHAALCTGPETPGAPSSAGPLSSWGATWSTGPSRWNGGFSNCCANGSQGRRS
jgi:citrate synthase